MAARTLHDAGLEVLEARDGFDGIGILTRRSHDVDLLVVDTEMPGVHGWDVIRFATAKTPRIRVLRLGRPDDVVPGQAYQAFQALPTLRKPFTPATLLARVRLGGASRR